MRISMAAVILAGLLLFVACANPAEDKSKAITGEVTSAAPQSQTQGVKYSITPQNSRIEFIASKVTGSHNGSFKDFSGVIEYPGQPEESHVNVTINMASVETDTPDLTKHLQTPDFFDVAKFPQATFVSTEIKPGGEKEASHTITGNFQLHGVTKSITFPATIKVNSDDVEVKSEFSINRKDFGITYAGKADDLIRDGVVIRLDLKAPKKK